MCSCVGVCVWMYGCVCRCVCGRVYVCVGGCVGEGGGCVCVCVCGWVGAARLSGVLYCIVFLVSVSDNLPYAIFIGLYQSAFTRAVNR